MKENEKSVATQMTFVVETITPEVAEEYLKKNLTGRNRNLSQSTVASYAATMKRGEWKLNGESIKFDTDGVLTDGQHRLEAVKKSGCTIQALVVREVSPEAFATYDCGRSRTAGQIIGMQGIQNYNAVAVIVNSLYALRTNKMSFDNTKRGFSTSRVSKLTNDQIIKEFENNRSLYIFYGQKAVGIRSRVGKFAISNTYLAAVWMHLVEDLGYSQCFVDNFFEQLTSLETAQTPVINELRKRLLASRDNTTIFTMQYKVNLLFKTWNHYVHDENPKRLMWSDKEGNIDLIPNPNK